MGRLQGKTAFLTAAAQGIGRATALAFHREGAKVIATDLSEEHLAALAAEVPGMETFTLDALNTDDVKAAAQRAGPVDILFNCAGFVHAGTVLDYTDEEFDFAFNLNVRAMFRTIRAAVPGMIERGGGSIINMASAASSIMGAPNRTLYGASKAAVIGLTKAVAKDYVEQGIRANAISPVAATRMLRRSVEPGTFTPGQVAPGVAYLASRDCDFNGAILHAANGRFSLMNLEATEPRDFSGTGLTPEAVGAWLETVATP